MIQIKDKRFKIFIPAEELKASVKALAARISADYKGKDPILCPQLSGSFIFAADLVRELDFDAQLSFVKYTSYEGTQSTGVVTPQLGFSEDCRGRDVIIVEDIVETGISMEYTIAELKKMEPRSIAICTMFFKPGRLQRDIHVDYVGKEIPDEFILGYGLDYDGYGRTLADLYVLAE